MEVGVYVLDFGLVGRQAMEDGKVVLFWGFCLTTAQVLYSSSYWPSSRERRLYEGRAYRENLKRREDDLLVLLTDGLAAFFCCYNFLLFLEKPTLAAGASDVQISFETCIDYVVDSVGLVC